MTTAMMATKIVETPESVSAGPRWGQRRWAKLLLSILLAGVAPCVAASGASNGTLDELLSEADRLRTSDRDRLDQLLTQIDRGLNGATGLQLAKARMLRAYRFNARGESGFAERELMLVLEGQPDLPTRVSAASMLANTFAMRRSFEDSLRMLDQMLPLLPEVDDRDLRHRGLLTAAVVYNQVGEYQLALQHVAALAADEPDARTRCAIGSITMEARYGLQQPSGDAYALGALRQCEAVAESIFSGFVRWHLAREWERGQRGAEALELLSSSLAEVEATGYPFLIAQYHALLAELRLAEGATEAAAGHAATAIAQSSASTSAQSLISAYGVQYRIAERAGDTAAALAAYRLYAEAERTHSNDIKSREMAYQVVRHQSMQQAQQIELLHQKNQLLELQQSVTEQRARSWLLIALVLIGLITTIGFWALRIKRLQMRLKRMTETDALTGIFNRQHFSERARAALLQCERDGVPAALVMFDLDHFKQVNDRYGHAAGDWALREVAAAVQPLCRGVDAFGRLGGEEFGLVLPGLDAAAAVRLAGDAQARFAAIDTTAAGYAFRLAASFGVAEAGAGMYTFATLLSHADQAMYAAKHGGRRQVRVYTADAPDILVAGAIGRLRDSVGETAAPALRVVV